MKYELVIKADHNDADYVTSINTVEWEDIQAILPVIEAIKVRNAGTRRGSGEYNWYNGDYHRRDSYSTVYAGILTKDQMEMFSEYVPYVEHGIHTIESVVYYPLPEKTKLL